MAANGERYNTTKRYSLSKLNGKRVHTNSLAYALRVAQEQINCGWVNETWTIIDNETDERMWVRSTVSYGYHCKAA